MTIIPIPTTDDADTDAGPEPVSTLRWLADTYEQSQRVRIETGERIRAVVQGRDSTFEPLGVVGPAEPDNLASSRWIDGDGVVRSAEETLDAVLAGETVGPVPILGRTYLRHYEAEREMFREMGRALKSHPAYPWLSRVKGIGATLASKLLARLEATKAPHASSFWAYAGLATVPGALYRCATCGIERSFPPSYDVTGSHKRNGNGAACPGSLVRVAGADVRVAAPRPGRGQKAPYDQYAKKILYLVGTSFLKAGGPYEQHYRAHRERLERERPGWADGRRHLTALRITEKLFLSHLWQVWREALGLPTPRPWAEAHGGHDGGGHIEPWSMVEPEKRPRSRAA